MRIQGRTLRPSTLAERRLLLSLGLEKLKVPRGTNPFSVVRKVQKVARDASLRMSEIRDVAMSPHPRASTTLVTSEDFGPSDDAR